MSFSFEKISSFKRGILHRQLADAYSFDNRYGTLYEKDWITYDNFIFDNLSITVQCGFITVLDGTPIGHITWDPRNIPQYVEIGHNCILSKYKGNGYGKLQLQEAVKRIQQYNGLKKIIVGTNRNLIAPHNYERAGFHLCQIRKNESEASFAGDYLDYEISI